MKYIYGTNNNLIHLCIIYIVYLYITMQHIMYPLKSYIIPRELKYLSLSKTYRQL